jgi:hypothetical protein
VDCGKNPMEKDCKEIEAVNSLTGVGKILVSFTLASLFLSIIKILIILRRKGILCC